jgi:hypothetical protein
MPWVIIVLDERRKFLSRKVIQNREEIGAYVNYLWKQKAVGHISIKHEPEKVKNVAADL